MAQLHLRSGEHRFTAARGTPVPRRAARWLGIVLFVAACGESRNERSATLDSALDRDLTLAASATSAVSIGDTAMTSPAAAVATPEPTRPQAPTPAPRVSAPPSARPVPRTPTPRASTPAPAPVATPSPSPEPTATAASAAPAPDAVGGSGRTRTFGTGLVLTGPTSTAICSLAQRPGDRFVLSLGREVSGSDGAVLPAGTPVIVELARVDSTTGEFSFRLRGIQVNGEFVPASGTVRVDEGNVTERKVSKGGSDQGKVITGAIIGGILGRVMGGGARGAVIGAAGGAAAGTIAAARNNTIERCLAAGATLSATVSAPVTLPPAP